MSVGIGWGSAVCAVAPERPARTAHSPTPRTTRAAIERSRAGIDRPAAPPSGHFPVLSCRMLAVQPSRRPDMVVGPGRGRNDWELIGWVPALQANAGILLPRRAAASAVPAPHVGR